MKKDKEALVAVLKEKELTIGSCESFTAGAFCATIADVAGASAVLKGGLVTYATELKETLAHVDTHVIDTYGVISEECASAMAKSALPVLNCDICVSFTGNAGPDAWEGKPAGLLYCAIANKQRVAVYEIYEKLSRNELRAYAVQFMIEKVIKFLSE